MNGDSRDVNTLLREGLTIVGAFVVLSLVATFPLVRHISDALPGDLGDPLLGAWTFGWDADRLRHGLSGLWDAPILFPNQHTFAYSEHLLGLAIFVAPIIWLTGNSIAAYNVAWIFTAILAGSGMYLLARKLTGRRDAALIAGIAFAFGPPRAGQLSHIQVLASGWMPIALWGLHEYFDSRSKTALAVFAAAFALQALSNGYFMYFLAIPAAIVIGYELTRPGMHGRRASAIAALAAAGAGIAFVLAPVAAAYLSVRTQTGFVRSYGEWTMYGANVTSYLSAGGANRLWGPLLTLDIAPERQLFPGLTLLVLAAIGWWPGGNRPIEKRRALYAAIAAICFFVSLGPEPRAGLHKILPFGPYLWLTKAIPGFDAMRVPARMAATVYLALSALGAFGAARLLTRVSPGRRTIAAAAIAAAAIATLLFIEGLAAPIPLVAFDPHGRPDDRSVYHWLALHGPGAAIELPIHDWSIAPTLTYQYATLVHRHPIVNGYTGRRSTMQSFLGVPGSPLTELDRIGDALELLQAVGVRYVIVHPHDYDDPAVGDATAAAIRRSTPHIAEEYQFSGGIAFRLRDVLRPAQPARSGTPIDMRGLRVTASDAPDRVARLADGDPATRWFIERPQDGREWIRVDFDRPRDISRVVLLMAQRSLGDYPRGLAIESVRAGETMALFEGNALVPYGLTVAALDNVGRTPEIAISLSPNTTDTLILRQTGRSRSWWSVHELMLFER